MSTPQAPSNENTVDQPRVKFENCYIPESIPAKDVDDHVKRKKDNVTRPYEPQKDELLAYYGKDSTFLSFGDDGTTASIIEEGQLMQFCRYLGPGRSSMFVVDHARTPEPVKVQPRGMRLRSMAQFGQGFGTDFSPPDYGWDHKVFFLRDRWPRIESTCDGRWKFVSQWMVKDGVVIQQSLITNTSNEDVEFEHQFDDRILIRELDFVDDAHSFNKDGKKEHAGAAGPNEYGWVLVHRMSDSTEQSEKNESGESSSTWYKTPAVKRSEVKDGKEDETVIGDSDNRMNEKNADKVVVVSEDEVSSSEHRQDVSFRPEAVGLVVGFFVNGEAKKRDEILRGESYSIKPKETLAIVDGYKLVLLTSKVSDWKPLVLSAVDVDIDRFLAEEGASYRVIPTVLHNDQQMNYALRRNLEHILSVCTIPIQSGYVWDYDDTKTGDNDRTKTREPDERAVALTCGDMSGHRVVHSASFFAFKFLTAIAKYLGDFDNTEHLRDRIQRTCEAHLRWVFTTAKTQNNHFAAQYWVDGNIMPSSDSKVLNDLTSTPYQILKAFEYYQTFGDEGVEVVVNWLRGENGSAVMSWIEKLDKESVPDSYAWRHPNSSDPARYRLDDHVWLWSALRAISVILKWDFENKKAKRRSKSKRNDQSDESLKEDDQQDLRRKYDPSSIQREIIRRFTTEMELLKQKMLAVTRSTQESRFNFHSRDTALFYELPGLKSEPESKKTPAKMLSIDVAVWQNTLNCQPSLEENQETEWDNPLRYALHMLMERLGFHINSREGIFTKAYEVLRDSMLPNGLFPGQIDEFAQESGLFADKEYRDFYFHVCFEVPYVIWECEHMDRLSTPKQTPATLGRQGGPASVPVLVTGKIPFNNFVNSRNISEVTDQWLYKYPPFLEFEPPEITLPPNGLTDMLNGEYGDVLKGAIGIYKNSRLDWKDEFRYPPFSQEELRKKDYMFNSLEESHGCLILDVKKKAPESVHHSVGPKIPVQRHSIRYLWNQLQQKRETADAKKRFIWLPFATIDCALMCVLTAHKAEMVPMGLFFEHHATSDCYFFDEAVPIHNKWETEFHMRFIQLKHPHVDISGYGGTEVIQPWSDDLPDFENQKVVRGSAGYRILGDFFNHFWTCHFIERYPRKRGKDIECPLPWPTGLHKGELTLEEDEGDFWQQRRVLELMLFNRIITEVNSSTKEIVSRIKNLKVLRSGNLSTEEYFKNALELENVIQILGAMESDFIAIMDNIDAWERREQDRQQGQPRWPTSNERKYRSAMIKLLVFNQRILRELRGYQATVKSLRESLVANQKRSGNDLGLRSQLNIQYFTYATVVFLPLGFVSSLFAMAAVPTKEVVRNMVIYSVIALAITLCLLAVARLVWKLMKDMSKGVLWLTRRFRQQYRYVKQQLERRHRRKVMRRQLEELTESNKALQEKLKEVQKSLAGAENNV